MHNKLTIGTELIFTCRKQTVGLFLGYLGCPGDQKMVISCKIVIITVFNKLVASQFAVFGKVHISVFVINEGTGDSFNELTVVIKCITADIFTIGSNCASADNSVTLVVEVICIAFNL